MGDITIVEHTPRYLHKSSDYTLHIDGRNGITIERIVKHDFLDDDVHWVFLSPDDRKWYEALPTNRQEEINDFILALD